MFNTNAYSLVVLKHKVSPSLIYYLSFIIFITYSAQKQQQLRSCVCKCVYKRIVCVCTYMSYPPCKGLLSKLIYANGTLRCSLRPTLPLSAAAPRFGTSGNSEKIPSEFWSHSARLHCFGEAVLASLSSGEGIT